MEPKQMKKEKKDKFADLDEEFKSNVESMDDDALRQEIAKNAIQEMQNQQMKKDDIHLAEMKAQFDEAGEVYKEATKGNKLRMAFANSILEARQR